MPKFLGYFERVLAYTDSGFLAGASLSYMDLSMFQVLEGLAYAFPNAFAALRDDIPRLLSLRDRVAARPNIAAYLQSERRMAFNEHGIFRRYPELEPQPPDSPSTAAVPLAVGAPWTSGHEVTAPRPARRDRALPRRYGLGVPP